MPRSASEPSGDQRKRRGTVQLIDLGPSRPPCSVAEREIAEAVERRIRAAGWRAASERVRAPTSPTWAPLVRSLLRVWAAAFLAAGWPLATIGLAAGAVIGGIGAVGGLLRFVPLLGSTSRNVVGVKRGSARDTKPIVVVAHMDTHATAGVPMPRWLAWAAELSGWVALVAGVVGVAGRPGAGGWRPAAAFIAAESVFTLAWLSRYELKLPREIPDDNTSGLLTLVRIAELVDRSPLRDVYLVASAAGTAGNHGLTAFFRAHPKLRAGWVIEVDALGSGEVVAAPHPARFPFPGTPSALTRALVTASHETGDPLPIRRVRCPHSDAKAALRGRIGAITLTAGIEHPAEVSGPDTANAERAARIVVGLARLDV